MNLFKKGITISEIAHLIEKGMDIIRRQKRLRHDEGSKEVLVYTNAPTELAYTGQELLEELKERSAEDVLLFILDSSKAWLTLSLAYFQKWNIKYVLCMWGVI